MANFFPAPYAAPAQQSTGLAGAKNNPKESLGTLIGRGLGNAVGGGIKGLLLSKLSTMEQEQQERKQQKIAENYARAGLPTELAYLPESIQKSLIDRLEGLQFGAQPQTPQNVNQEILQEAPVSQEPTTQTGGLRIGPSSLERRHRETLEQQRNLANEKTKTQYDIEKKKDFDKAQENLNATNERLTALRQMKELEDTGNLNSPLWSKLMTDIGFESLLTGESQAFLALEKEFLKDLKSIFGGRITDIEMKTFLRAIPRLQNTAAGRKIISDNLRAYYKARQLHSKVYINTMKNNRNLSPLDLNIKVAEEIKRKEDKLAEQFTKNLTHLEQESSSKMYRSKKNGKYYRYINGKPVEVQYGA